MLQQTLESISQSALPAISSSAQDRLWISQTLAGDTQAYACLINKYKVRLFELCCRILKNPSQGEDVLQEAFIRAYRNLHRFRYESTFSTWMYTIVMNGLRNHLRRTRTVRWSSLDARQTGDDRAECPETAHPEDSIDMLVERKLDIETIRRLAASLPPHYQSIFMMHYFQNMSLQEIADRLEKPLGTVKVYLHRARKRLYNDFKKYADRPKPLVTPFIPLVLA